MIESKVFGIGLNKTGTTSLAGALKQLGYAHAPFSDKIIRAFWSSQMLIINEFVQQYDSFEDWPWPSLFEYVDRRHHDSKFILTRRKNAETWFDSLSRHAKRTGPTEYRKRFYGFEMPTRINKQHHIQIYETHLIRVREYFFKKNDRFLEVCWEEGDGWKEICNFLDKPLPKRPFPHLNKAARNPSTTARTMKS